MIRTISHTEAATALDCFAKHAFSYTGNLTGGTALSVRATVPQLRDGKAWGAAVASYHERGHGHIALANALVEDRREMREAGIEPDEQTFAGTLSRLTRMLDHYASTSTPLGLIDLERELEVPLASRRSTRASTRYRFRCFLDGVHVDEFGRSWIVEFKLRKRLQSDELIALSRQTRWYAWAWTRTTGQPPAGVIVDERLNDVPGAVRHNQNGSVSKVQNCTVDHYEIACERAEQEPDAEVIEKLRSKVWQKRTTIMLREAEIEEASWQLQSAARLISQLDSGVLYPIRNPSPSRCPSCQFRPICDDPNDFHLVDSLYRRVVPKWQRPELEAA